MALNHSPRIITSQLIMCFDPANLRSYPGSGTAGYDISGNNYTETLLNGVSYSTSNLGIFTFDGVDDYCTGSDPGQQTRYTVESWFKPTSYPNNNSCTISSVYPGTNATVNFKIGYDAGSTMSGGFYDGSWHYTPSVSTSLNTWQCIAYSYDGSNLTIYSNGSSGGSTAYTGTPNSGGSGIRIGRRWDVDDYFAGSIGAIKVYSRALSATEVLQNFNALRGRYGL